MRTGNRPLSPHLQVYRLPLLALMSITHRATGVFLALGTVLLAYWFGAAAYGPEVFANAQAFVGSWIGVLLLMGWSAALFYHLCNGIRHLLWDIGWGFELPRAYASGYVAIAVALLLTLITWAVGLSL